MVSLQRDRNLVTLVKNWATKSKIQIVGSSISKLVKAANTYYYKLCRKDLKVYELDGWKPNGLSKQNGGTRLDFIDHMQV